MKKIMEVRDLIAEIDIHGQQYPVVDRVSLDVKEGEILGIVGESGCGKSVTAMALMRLLKKDFSITSGEILLDGQNLTEMNSRQMERIRGKEISMIFQDVMTSLNPLMKIGYQIMEPLVKHCGMTKQQAKEEAIQLLKNVGIPSPEKRFHQYPNSLSGGMRQRVMIAIAIACKPKLLIADEPTTALDVTVQAQILDLLCRLRKESHTAIMLITHDLGVVYETCDRAAVMYCGQVVEESRVKQLFDAPLHPYTQGLLKSIPSAVDKVDTLYNISGTVPPVVHYPSGCRFADRCEQCREICRQKAPEMLEMATGHKVRCHLYQEGLQNG